MVYKVIYIMQYTMIYISFYSWGCSLLQILAMAACEHIVQEHVKKYKTGAEGTEIKSPLLAETKSPLATVRI
jgi:hypothetical protein